MNDSYAQILEAGSRPHYQLAVVASMVLGGWLIHRDSRTWPLGRSTRLVIISAVAVGTLVGCAIPAFLAGGAVGERAFTSVVTPKTVLGGLLFGFFAAAVVKRILNVPYDTSDSFARGGCLVMAVGRLGCIAQHCCFGRATGGPLGFDFGDGVQRFPTQAVEAVILFLLLGVLHVLHTRRILEHRRLFVLFAGYGAVRFVLEFLREDIASRWMGVGFYQWLALLLLMVGLYQIVLRTRRLSEEGGAVVTQEATG